MTFKNKNLLRAFIKEQKKNLDNGYILENSKMIFENIEKLDIFKKSKVFSIYWSFGKEVYTHDFINKWHKSKTILLPCIDGNNLVLKQFIGEQNLITNKKLNIPEPSGNEYCGENIDIIFIPGLAFDKNNNRLGRGKGFYDVFLQKYPLSYKIGIALKLQFFDAIPIQDHDIKMDLVITN